MSVTVLGDGQVELAETFQLLLSQPEPSDGSILIGNAVGTGTIVDDDNLAIRIRDAEVDEPDTGESQMVFAVELSAPSPQEVRVNYVTADRQAVSGQDYRGGSGVIVFPPGTTRKEVRIAVLPDDLDEPDETFEVDLSNPEIGRAHV